MDLTEKERLLLVEKKEEIRRLTEDIIDFSADLEKNKTEIKKRVSSILSLISTIASYTNSKNIQMHPLQNFATHIFYQLEMKTKLTRVITTELEIFCNIVNSLTFNFTKIGLRVDIQKIDLSILRTGK
uniref:Uncharacterized protein n=1 Tax=uncultured crenarchaeote MCG TaxID=529375 RepID=B2YI74_9CREN|nr:hypothetical protein [uncultured crenarchaeote MCG]